MNKKEREALAERTRQRMLHKRERELRRQDERRR